MLGSGTDVFKSTHKCDFMIQLKKLKRSLISFKTVSCILCAFVFYAYYYSNISHIHTLGHEQQCNVLIARNMDIYLAEWAAIFEGIF